MEIKAAIVNFDIPLSAQDKTNVEQKYC
jgi:hypothetical protein